MRAVPVLVMAVVAGASWGVWPLVVSPSVSSAHGEPITGCRGTDGDTIRCGDERIRLLGIDAPELPGHCRAGRHCAPGDPVASSARLAAELAGPLAIVRVSEDRYGRTLGMVSGAHGDLSCWQLAGGAAIYRADWDDGGRVAAACPSAIS